MNRILCLSIRFVQPYPLFHGSRDGGVAEWPPSPMRVFQALLNAASLRSRGRSLDPEVYDALRGLEVLRPRIVAPEAAVSTVGYRAYVPHNHADLVAAAWARGNDEASVASHRIEKDIRPMRIVASGDELPALHYLYPLPAEMGDPERALEVVRPVVRAVHQLGWGIDQVIADVQLIDESSVAKFVGEEFKPAKNSGTPLRTPRQGSLEALQFRHERFLNRLSGGSWTPVPPMRFFDVVNYRRTSEPDQRPFCVFQILKPDASGNRSFCTAGRTRDVAAWTRHAVAEVCRTAGWSDFAGFVHGHAEEGGPRRGPGSQLRFQYLPLPTINAGLNRVESIRRVLIAAPPGFEERIGFIRKRLIGRELRWNGEVMGILNLQAGKDWVRDQYVGESRVWTSVTPVILDGYDDRNKAKTERLILRALTNAGITTNAKFEWQPFGFRSGVEPVQEFRRPKTLHGTMIHLRIEFERAVCGPLAIGAGRFRGFGLLASGD